MRDINSFIEEILQDKIPIKNYRGNFGLQQGVQGAEYFLRLRNQDYTSQFSLLFFAIDLDEMLVKFRIDDNSYSIKLMLTTAPFLNYLNCHASEKKSPHAFKLISITKLKS